MLQLLFVLSVSVNPFFPGFKRLQNIAKQVCAGGVQLTCDCNSTSWTRVNWGEDANKY